MKLLIIRIPRKMLSKMDCFWKWLIKLKNAKKKSIRRSTKIPTRLLCKWLSQLTMTSLLHIEDSKTFKETKNPNHSFSPNWLQTSPNKKPTKNKTLSPSPPKQLLPQPLKRRSQWTSWTCRTQSLPQRPSRSPKAKAICSICWTSQLPRNQFSPKTKAETFSICSEIRTPPLTP